LTLPLARPESRRGFNLSYRLLGSLADAEDVVQETYARWYAMSPQQQAAIESPAAWLTKVASRKPRWLASRSAIVRPKRSISRFNTASGMVSGAGSRLAVTRCWSQAGGLGLALSISESRRGFAALRPRGQKLDSALRLFPRQLSAAFAASRS
jgi:hypothetical protein